ncbi:hypothetical protein V6Z11_D13G145900 [Gossypium hirsutum]
MKRKIRGRSNNLSTSKMVVQSHNHATVPICKLLCIHIQRKIPSLDTTVNP